MGVGRGSWHPMDVEAVKAELTAFQDELGNLQATVMDLRGMVVTEQVSAYSHAIDLIM